jgi:hypothetical protein
MNLKGLKLKKMKNILLLSIIVGLFSSCAKNIYVPYQTETANTGKIILRPAKVTKKTFVTINDNLIVNKKKVKSITIGNVPSGEYKIQYTSDNKWYKDKLDSHYDVKMENNKEITKLIEVPPYSTGYWVYNGITFAVCIGVWYVVLYGL